MQKIYFGAPGTGKSYEIDQFLNKNGVEEENVFRVTFHPEYTYNDFVGQLIPKMEKLQNGETVITYSFEKGQFTLALEKAYEDISKPVYLIIEEMSRGNCAAIFGDIFQLLDRVSSGTDKGFSRYFINNAIIESNDTNIDVKNLIEGKTAIVSNTRYLGNDYETAIYYELNDRYDVMYIFDNDDLLIFQVGFPDEGSRFIAYK